MNFSTVPSLKSGYEASLQFSLFQEMLALHAARQCLKTPTNVGNASSLALPLLVSFLLLAHETHRGHMYLSLMLWQGKTLALNKQRIKLALSQLTIIETENTNASEVLKNAIADHQGESIVDGEDELFLFTLPPLDNWLTILTRGLQQPSGDAEPLAILLLDDHLYLRRNRNQEEEIARKLQSLAKKKELKVVVGGPGSGKTTAIFATLVDWTCSAVKKTIDAQSNGNKSYSTRERLLQAIASLPHIALTAPTGKAVVRLKNSLNNSLQQLFALLQSSSPLEKNHPLGKAYPQIAAFPKDIQSEILLHLQNSIEQTQTMHRLVESSLNIISVERKLAKKTLLHFNIVIIDEMSMISYEVFYELLCQLSQNIRLQLVGDPHQLASSNSGNLLKNICEAPKDIDQKSRQLFVETVTQLHGQSHRFKSNSTVGKVAHYLLEVATGKQKASRQGFLAIANAAQKNTKNEPNFKGNEGIDNLHVLKVEKPAALEKGIDETSPSANDTLPVSVQEVLTQHFLPHQLAMLKTASRPFVSEEENQDLAQELLRKFQTKTILTATNNGSLSRTEIGNFLQAMIAANSDASPHGNKRFFPVVAGNFFMVLKNDYKKGIFNGDIGVALKDRNNKLRLYFDKTITASLDRVGLAYQGDESYWSSHAHRVFALTIHKSQGAEFDHILVLFPSDAHFQKMQNPNFLSRELLYTALTRAKKSAWLYVEPLVLEALLSQSERKYSALNQLLWQPQKEE